MQPLEVVQAALREAPGDADRLLSWFINSAAPGKRRALYERLASALGVARLTGQIAERVPTPSLFTAEAADRVWTDLIENIASVEGASDRLAPFFRPDHIRFAPQAYPGRWTPVTWNTPLSPEEVRDVLSVQEIHVRELVEIAKALVECGDPQDARMPRIGVSEHFHQLQQAKLRVGVLPYGDALPMVTLLYAVSDLVDGIAFGRASFYRQRSRDAKSVWIGDGTFNAGYATAHQLDALARTTGLQSPRHEVFQEGFTRSLFLRARFDRQRPQLDHLSFVGQFGPERTCTMDDALSDPLVAARRLQFQDTFAISEYLDPVVNWEIPLILAFASGINGFDKSLWDGLALTVSTDAHLWAASFGLNLEVDAAAPATPVTFAPTFRRGAWTPANQTDVSEEDLKSELCWYVPGAATQSSRLVPKLSQLVARLIDLPMADGLNMLRDTSNLEALAQARHALSPIARSLLAPLLTVLPTYRGPMIAAPPEAWLAKLQGPAAYVCYRPPWHERVKTGASGKDAEERTLIDYLRDVA